MNLCSRYLAVILCLACCVIVRAQGGYDVEPVARHLSVPVRMAFAPDGRLFYLELFTGNVKVILGDSLQNGTWLHVESNTVLERGLLGIAFDPEFNTNHYVYLFYTTKADTPSNRVERYTEVNWRADSSSRTILFDQSVSTPCGIASNHNGGGLAFGTDGKLYVTLGENACPELAGRIDDPRGKVLRIEPHIASPYNAVADNPWYDDGDPFTGNDDRIYAKGFRNPFGITWSTLDSSVYVTENGPDCNDEIDHVLPGNDYGWRPACDPSMPDHCACPQDAPYTTPLWGVSPTIAPTGLVVYTGSIYPELFGKIIFVDNNQGYIRAGTFLNPDSLDVSVISMPIGLGSLFDIVQGPDGYLYISHFDGIWRLKPLATAMQGDVEPKVNELMQNVPNPFNPLTTFTFQTTEFGNVRLIVYDILGRKVAELVNDVRSPGIYSVTWNASAFPSGMYVYQLSTASNTLTKQMLLLK